MLTADQKTARATALVRHDDDTENAVEYSDEFIAGWSHPASEYHATLVRLTSDRMIFHGHPDFAQIEYKQGTYLLLIGCIRRPIAEWAKYGKDIIADRYSSNVCDCRWCEADRTERFAKFGVASVAEERALARAVLSHLLREARVAVREDKAKRHA